VVPLSCTYPLPPLCVDGYASTIAKKGPPPGRHRREISSYRFASRHLPTRCKQVSF